MKLSRVRSYFDFYRTSKSRKGHGVHSPFIYDLVSDVLNDQKIYRELEEISTLRKRLSKSKEEIDYSDPGAGSLVFKSNTRRISDIIKYASTNEKYGRLLFLLVKKYKPETIIELGTSLGLGTSYLAIGSGSQKVYTIEAVELLTGIAEQNFRNLGLSNINLINGPFITQLPELGKKLDRFDLVFFDGHHGYEPSLNYFEFCLEKAGNDSIFIFDDIRWSEEMEELWNTVRFNTAVSCSIELFRMGLVFFRRELSKQHFRIRY